MITPLRSQHTISDDLFTDMYNLVDRAGAPDLIAQAVQYRRERGEPGGRPPTGFTYTPAAVLVALGCLLSLGMPVSIRAMMGIILTGFTSKQQHQLGVHMPDGFADTLTDQQAAAAEYARFHGWLGRALAGLDSLADIPARRALNSTRAARIAARSTDEADERAWAKAHCDRLINAIVAASIYDPLPAGYRGDVVVDESTYTVSSRGRNQGNKPHHVAPTSPAAAIYTRAGGVIVDPGPNTAKAGKPTAHRASTTAAGIAVTALARVGPPGAIHSVAPVVTAIHVDVPMSANINALDHVLTVHRDTGFAPPPGKPNARRPYLIGDMGYNTKNAFPGVLHTHGYDQISRYPKNWGTSLPAKPGPGQGDTPPGPILVDGSWCCPAVLATNPGKTLLTRTRDLKTRDAWRQHDDRIRTRFPFLMGMNSRVTYSRATPGRPKKDEEPTLVPKIELVCPAEQQRLRCPLRPDSLNLNPATHHTAEPTWKPETFTCCHNMQTTVHLDETQVKMHQPAVPPGSWEHTYLFEAYRSLTERTFSHAKNPAVTNLQSMNFGPRREPLQKITIAFAFAFAIANLHRQASFTPDRADTTTTRMTELRARLGRPPATIPART